MLSHLSIKHYALIESLDIDFDRGLNILTGETGSGKSIILGALGLLIGDRAETRIVQEGKKKCIVEARFFLEEIQLKALFEKYDIDFEEETLIRREILSSGKSRAFVNDTPVKLNVLKDLGARLLDIHSQHQTIRINDPGFQLEVVDNNAKTAKEIDTYRQTYEKWRHDSKKLEELRLAAKESKNESEFIAFQLRELEEARLDDMDEEALDEEYNTLANAVEIAERLREAEHLLGESENAVVSAMREAKERLEAIAEYGKIYSELSERLNSSLIEIDDVLREVGNLSESVDPDPKRLEILEDQRSRLFRLEQKHGVEGLESLIAKRDELKRKFDETDQIEARIAELENTVEDRYRQVLSTGKKLNEKREKSLKSFSSKIEKVLKSLNMKAARFDIELNPLDVPSSRGLDAVNMRFSANAGRKPESLKQVASGGELSRLMLAIKSIAAASSNRKTIFFDEIDTGVSGEVAHAMGAIMKEMAAGMQVISITHLPQIASRGQAHFKVFKRKSAGIEKTEIKRLDPDRRIEEIAQMLSGANTTDAALENARELLLSN